MSRPLRTGPSKDERFGSWFDKLTTSGCPCTLRTRLTTLRCGRCGGFGRELRFFHRDIDHAATPGAGQGLERAGRPALDPSVFVPPPERAPLNRNGQYGFAKP